MSAPGGVELFLNELLGVLAMWTGRSYLACIPGPFFCWLGIIILFSSGDYFFVLAVVGIYFLVVIFATKRLTRFLISQRSVRIVFSGACIGYYPGFVAMRLMSSPDINQEVIYYTLMAISASSILITLSNFRILQQAVLGQTLINEQPCLEKKIGPPVGRIGNVSIPAWIEISGVRYFFDRVDKSKASDACQEEVITSDFLVFKKPVNRENL